METNESSLSITLLGYWSCYFLRSPGTKDTPGLIISPVDNKTAYECFMTSEYLTGPIAGPSVRVFLCILITLVGVTGMLANIVNIIVLRHSMKGSFLQRLLIVLAIFDLIVSCFAVFTSIFLQVILDNVNRSESVLNVFKVFYMFYSLGRTGSVFMAVLISIERYAVVAYPVGAKAWLTPRRSTTILVVWLVFIVLLNLPWWLNTVVTKTNLEMFPEGQLASYPYVFETTQFARKVYYTDFRVIHLLLDFVVSVPILLVCNGLMYRSIHQWNKGRQNLAGSYARDINAAKMFSIVVLAVLSCHTFAVIDVIIIHNAMMEYRELNLGIILTVTLNATVNFFIYYAFGQTFRDYFWFFVNSKVLRRPEQRPPTLSEGIRKESTYSADVVNQRCINFYRWTVSFG